MTMTRNRRDHWADGRARTGTRDLLLRARAAATFGDRIAVSVFEPRRHARHRTGPRVRAIRPQASGAPRNIPPEIARPADHWPVSSEPRVALPRHGSCVLGQRPPYFALSGATFPGDPLGQAIGRLSGVSSPGRSASELGSVVLDDRWTHLRGGAFVVKDKETEIAPFATIPNANAGCGKPPASS